MTNYLSKGDQVIKEKEELLQSMGSQKQGLLAEKEMVYRAYINQKISMDDFGLQFNPISERVKQIDKQIPELQGEIDFLKIQYLNSGEILSDARNLHSKWRDLNFEEKRRIVENITENVIVGKENISINLCYLPSSSELTADKQRNRNMHGIDQAQSFFYSALAYRLLHLGSDINKLLAVLCTKPKFFSIRFHVIHPLSFH